MPSSPDLEAGSFRRILPQMRVTHCKQGHPMSGDNLYVSPKGRRICRACAKGWTKKSKIKNGKVTYKSPGPMTLDEVRAMTDSDWKRFWSKVTKIEGSCWVWSPPYWSGGYSYFNLNRRRVSGHRLIYFHEVGDIPKGMHIDHLCRNPACVNPDHLECVTHAENVRRGALYRKGLWNPPLPPPPSPREEDGE